MTQTIGGGFAAYFSERAEAVLEGREVANRSAGRTSTSPNWFAYARLRFANRVVPYLMHEDVRLAEGDSYFTADRFRREIVDIRYEQTASAVLELEVRSLDRLGTNRATELGCQLALAF